MWLSDGEFDELLPSVSCMGDVVGIQLHSIHRHPPVADVEPVSNGRSNSNVKRRIIHIGITARPHETVSSNSSTVYRMNGMGPTQNEANAVCQIKNR